MRVKSQKGSITIFVLIALLFYMAFLLLLYANNLNKVQTITEKVETLKSIYSQNYDNVDEVYNRHKGIQIGDYVNYDELSNAKKTYTIDYTQNGGTSSERNQTLETEDLRWRLLDIADNGQITLISDMPISTSVYFGGENGYLKGINTLNNTCNELYGKGTYAESARSLNVEDVNKLTGYNPATYKEWGYRFPTEGEYMQYSRDNGTTWVDITNDEYQTFKKPGEEIISVDNRDDEGINVEYTYYSYSIIDKISEDKLDILLIGTEDNYTRQWLASRETICESERARFGLRGIAKDGAIGGFVMYASNGESGSNSLTLRPVVTLNSNVQLVKDTATDTWNIQ